MQCGERVLRLVPRVHVEADPAAAEGDVRAVRAQLGIYRSDAEDHQVVA